MQTVSVLRFTSATRSGSFDISDDDSYRAKHLYKLLQGQDMETRQKVADIRLVRSTLGCGLKDALLFVDDAYNSRGY